MGGEELPFPVPFNAYGLSRQFPLESLLLLSQFYDEEAMLIRGYSVGQPTPLTGSRKLQQPLPRDEGIAAAVAATVSAAAAGPRATADSSPRSPRGPTSRNEAAVELSLLSTAVQSCEAALASLQQQGVLRASRRVRARLDEIFPSWAEETGMRPFEVDRSIKWISAAAYDRSWRALNELVNPSNKNIVNVLAARLMSDVRIQEEETATNIAAALARQGCETWEDVMQLVDLVGLGSGGEGRSAAGARGAGSGVFETVNSFLQEAGVPPVFAGKLVTHLKQNALPY